MALPFNAHGIIVVAVGYDLAPKGELSLALYVCMHVLVCVCMCVCVL